MNVEIPEKQELLEVLYAALRETDRERLGVVGHMLADGLWPSLRGQVILGLHTAGLQIEDRFEKQLAELLAEKRAAEAKRQATTDKQREKALERHQKDKAKQPEVQSPDVKAEEGTPAQAETSQKPTRPNVRPASNTPSAAASASTSASRPQADSDLFSTDANAVK